MADTAEYILPDCGKEKFFPPYFPVVFLAIRSIPTVPEVLSSDRISEFLKIHSSKSTWFIYFNWGLDDMLLTLLFAFWVYSSVIHHIYEVFIKAFQYLQFNLKADKLFKKKSI